MILAFDIGNGSVKFARFAEGRRISGGRVPLEGPFPAPEAGESVAAVSVNPPALARLRAEAPGLAVVGEDLSLPLPVHYRPPGDLGLDRVLAVAGALHRRAPAPGVLVLEAGTCLTATIGVRGRGVLGGAIAPGPGLMARALAEHTAALPAVEPLRPGRVIGGSTTESIRSGVWAAFLGAARELVRGCREECGTPLEVVATGTGAGALAADLPEVDAVHPFAVLWGVYLCASGAGVG